MCLTGHTVSKLNLELQCHLYNSRFGDELTSFAYLVLIIAIFFITSITVEFIYKFESLTFTIIPVTKFFDLGSEARVIPPSAALHKSADKGKGLTLI